MYILITTERPISGQLVSLLPWQEPEEALNNFFQSLLLLTKVSGRPSTEAPMCHGKNLTSAEVRTS